MNLSVIIPVYNTPKKMLDFLFSTIANSNISNLTFIFINDGSDEETSSFLRSKCSANSFLLYEFQRNVGVSAARNKGIELTKTKYLMFVDSDDVIDFDLVSNLVIKNDIDIALFKDAIFFDNPVFKKQDINSIKDNKSIYDMYFKDSDGFNLRSACCKILSKKIIDDNNIKFDEELKFYEDAMFMSQYYSHISSYLAFDSILYYYRIHNSSSSKKFNKDYFKNYEIFFNKYKQKFLNNNLLICSLYKDTFFKVMVDKFARSLKKMHLIFAYKVFKQKCVIESSQWVVTQYDRNTYEFKLANKIIKGHYLSAFNKLLLHRINKSFSIRVKKLLKK